MGLPLVKVPCRHAGAAGWSGGGEWGCSRGPGSRCGSGLGEPGNGWSRLQHQERSQHDEVRHLAQEAQYTQREAPSAT